MNLGRTLHSLRAVKLEPCRCATCRECARYDGQPRCIMNGPYSGYVEVKTEEAEVAKS